MLKNRSKNTWSRLSVVVYAGIPDADGKNSGVNLQFAGMGAIARPCQFVCAHSGGCANCAEYDDGVGVRAFREIGIYSAVGLAPVHISFLFIAEACVYAVLGTVSGYLLGQGVIKILLWQGWLQGLNVNYSALSTVISSALVMVVVLISLALSRASGSTYGRARCDAPLEVARSGRRSLAF